MKKTVEAYNNKAEHYEQKWEKYLSHTHQRLLNIFESEENHRILDVSAGTGLFAFHLIQKQALFSEIVLNDVASEMLRIARNRFSEENKVICTENTAEDLNFDSSSFDSVISLNAFHNYKNQQMVLSEMYRVLKPGGALYILDWNRKGIFKWVNLCIKLFSRELIQTNAAEEMASYLESESFEIQEYDEWKYRCWNFYLIKAVK